MSTALAVERHADAEHFLADAESWLRTAEAENNLLLGIALRWRAREAAEPAPYWASIHDGGTIVGCACRTPPHRLVLSRLPPRAVAPLVEDAGAAYPALNGVHGPLEVAEAFAGAWTERHGGTWTTKMRLRAHELTRPSSWLGPVPPGALRKATVADLTLAREWIDAYVRDTGLDPPVADVAAPLIEHGQMYLWIDGDSPRSTAATARDTGSGCSINGVYTPPRYRRRGYGTAVVAALSDQLLAAGRRFCCLYTDAANPTSNSIYAKIGYRPIRDDAEIAFES